MEEFSQLWISQTLLQSEQRGPPLFKKNFFKRLCRCDIAIQRAGKHEKLSDRMQAVAQSRLYVWGALRNPWFQLWWCLRTRMGWYKPFLGPFGNSSNANRRGQIWGGSNRAQHTWWCFSLDRPGIKPLSWKLHCLTSHSNCQSYIW